jgi:phosphoribosylamine--glycine ligase
MRAEGHPFGGFLYVGLMITNDGPKVVEFNVRFGDPEAQVILPMLDEELPELLMAAATGALPSRAAAIRDERFVGVVVASAGYPESSDPGRVISGLDAAARVPGALVFHSGTAARGGDVVTAGGRVLTVVGRGASYQDAITSAYRAVGEVRFDGMQFRTDIGKKAIEASPGTVSAPP